MFLFVDSLNIHRFPTNKASRSSWATYIGRNDWEPKKDDRICSDHFKEEDLIRIESKVQIRKFAHPTRFKFRPKNSHTSDHEYCKPVANQDQVNQEHAYTTKESPQRTVKELDSKITVLKSKYRAKHEQLRRSKRKVQSLKNLLKELKNRDLISTDCQNYLSRKFSGVSLDILERAISKTKVGKKGKCSPKLKAFALTLQHYSQKAYDFVRQTFNLALPHPQVVRGWFNKGGFLCLKS